MTDNQTIKIPVKKSDGSMVYLTMAEIKAMKSKQNTPISNQSGSVLGVEDTGNKNKINNQTNKQSNNSIKQDDKLKSDSIKYPISNIPPSKENIEVKRYEDKEKIINNKSNSVIMNETKDLSSNTLGQQKDSLAPLRSAQNDKNNRQIKQSANQKIKYDKSFHSSPLEEKLKTQKANLPKLSPNRENEVDEIIKKLDISVPPDNVNRFRSILQLRLKDIRDDHQTEEVLLRPVLEGGMGFSVGKAKQVLSVIAKHEAISSSSVIARDEAISSDKDISKSTRLPRRSSVAPRNDIMEVEEDLPTVYKESPVPTVSTPNEHVFEHSSLRSPLEGGREVLASNGKKDSSASLHSAQNDNDDEKTKQITNNKVIVDHFSDKDNIQYPVSDISKSNRDKEIKRYNHEELKLNSTKPVKKTILHDIISPAGTVEFGPIEEIAHFTWHDFRNLSAKPIDAANRLKQKIQLLKDESYILYMQAVQAYHHSPIFNEYMEAVDESLRNRQPLSEVLASKGNLKMEEIQALIEMEKEL